MHLTMLYRGPLASCDYACAYCPFAKRRDSTEQLRGDRAALHRFTSWVSENTQDEVSVLFTPWGEGLVRSWYRDAMVALSRMPHVRRVAIQTNMSCRSTWIADCDLDTAAFWITYHPTQVTQDRFLRKCAELTRIGARFSVGIVGLPEHLDDARYLRKELPQDVYLWVNAAEGHEYTDDQAAEWQNIDPLFHYSRHAHVSKGLPCRTGDTVISVLGDGTVRRCHFVPQTIGNLYDGSFRAALKPRPCPLSTCDCHIGYVHLEPTGLYDVFAGGILERIPQPG
ncbi:STM4011 family radical SAM protein [Kibdelosporangium philippinense]|uniref:STM4011 family radical SAM protein n=1 Tax=Kibdelosporangium philippinense TaxID=211113 RepID=A0ABS8Z7N6_9PSEU|nr:STM4011 family radical SAM protein [Kibdelosporangium philippinense]MCE7002583.1 STM4011 family radical SAM protein [Kibdelosporangium philippinense]